MGIHRTGRPAPSRPRRLRRPALVAALGLAAVVLSGCGDRTEFERLGMPLPVTKEGHETLGLWQGAWIAALATGAVVWGLIFYAVVKFRRRHDDEIPVQTRYNLPLEIFYTIFPVIMVIVFFSHTVRVQNAVLHDDQPDNIVQVVGQQWSWTFNYPGQGPDGKNVYESGTGADIPDLYIPVGKTTEFKLHSPDVIHDFGVPGFLIKMDVVPGLNNHFEVTPERTGVFDGKCYELCGVYHSRMLFRVHVVDDQEYQAYLQAQEAAGFVSDEPICGGTFANTEIGQEPTDGAAESGAGDDSGTTQGSEAGTVKTEETC